MLYTLKYCLALMACVAAVVLSFGTSEQVDAALLDEFTSFDAGAAASGGTFTTSETGWSIKPAAANSPVTVSESGLAGVLGGTRYTTAQWTGASGDSTALYAGEYEGETGYFFLNTGAGTQYGWVDVLYDAGGAGLNADLSGEMGIRVVFDPDHLAFGKDSVMQITLTDADSSDMVEVRWVHPDDYVTDPGLGPLAIDFLFAGFTGIDLTHIQSVEFFYEGDYANDVAFHSISAPVPIPGAVWLLASGVIGLAGCRKKMKK